MSDNPFAFNLNNKRGILINKFVTHNKISGIAKIITPAPATSQKTNSWTSMNMLIADVIIKVPTVINKSS
jgi:hypothetical protein